MAWGQGYEWFVAEKRGSFLFFGGCMSESAVAVQALPEEKKGLLVRLRQILQEAVDYVSSVIINVKRKDPDLKKEVVSILRQIFGEETDLRGKKLLRVATVISDVTLMKWLNAACTQLGIWKVQIPSGCTAFGEMSDTAQYQTLLASTITDVSFA